MERRKLQAIPQSLFRHDYLILDGDTAVAGFTMSGWRKSGELSILGQSCRAYRDKAVRGAYVLESENGVLARAVKPRPSRRAFIIGHDGRARTLRAWSAFRRGFVLVEDDVVIGTLQPKGWFSRAVLADLPGDWPLHMNIFAIWLTALSWKSDDSFPSSTTDSASASMSE